MRAIVRRVEGLSACPGSYPQSRPRASSTKAPHPPWGYKDASCLQSNLHRDHLAAVEKPRQRTGRRINTVTLPILSMIRKPLCLLPVTRTSDAKNHRGRSNGSLMGRLFRSIVRPDPKLMEFNGKKRFARHCFYVSLNLFNLLKRLLNTNRYFLIDLASVYSECCTLINLKLSLLYSIDNILFSCHYYNFAIFLSNKYS